MKFIYQNRFKLFVPISVLIFFIANNAFSQNCPSFKIDKIENVSKEGNGGFIIVKITGSKTYSLKNFELRQKEGEVTGPIGYNVKMDISSGDLLISGLKKSEELYLKDYVLLFSDQACKNNAIIEIGTFKIK